MSERLGCPFCGLVDDHDDKCYFTLKAAGAMSGDLQRAWDRRAAPDSHVIPPPAPDLDYYRMPIQALGQHQEKP